MSKNKKPERRSRPRAIDAAMHLDRPAKTTIRGLWMDSVKEYVDEAIERKTPLYLTLPGAEGRDIQLLVERKFIKLTETGAISPDSQGLVVAVENSPIAVAELQKRFPGLNIQEASFQSLIHGYGLTSFPSKRQEKLCRALVVNLDLNQLLEAVDEDGNITFPVISWIRKLAELHKKAPRLDWTLCLTLHGELNWPKNICKTIQEFMAENTNRVDAFFEGCKTLLGEELTEDIRNSKISRFANLEPFEQQQILMVLVPKKLSHLIHAEGWRVETIHNLCYGEPPKEAPMVTWIFNFKRDSRASATPDVVYSESLGKIFSSTGYVNKDGDIE